MSKAIAVAVLAVDNNYEFWYSPDHYKTQVRVVDVTKTGVDQLCFDLEVVHLHSKSTYRQQFYIDDIDDYIALGKVLGSDHETINRRLVARRFLDQLELECLLLDELRLDHFGEEMISVPIATAEESECAMKA